MFWIQIAVVDVLPSDLIPRYASCLRMCLHFDVAIDAAFVASSNLGLISVGNAPSVHPCAPIDIFVCLCYHVPMKRTALFLKEEQINKLQKLSEKTGAPVAELIRRAIDKYLKERAKELK
jgi:ribbon-helix-helix protein